MISAVVLTKNEERNIKDCLTGLSWCNEIIVLDDNSTDKTVEIAQNLKATIIIHGLDNDFAGQRNFGLEKARGEWVLFIDADERISPMLANEIKSICYPQEIKPDSENKDVNLCWQDKNVVKGFYIHRKDIFLHKLLNHGETGRIKLLRLAKKDAGRWHRKVHEVWDINGKTSTLKFEMSHFPHPTVSTFLQDINYYSDLNARQFYEEGVRFSPWQIAGYPLAKFINNYFIKLGVLDGTVGFIHAVIMSFHSFMTRGKLWQLHNQKPPHVE